MLVWEFEEAVWDLERIRIVVRTGSDDETEPYTHRHPERETNSAAAFLRDRIQPCIGEREAIVIDGTGRSIYGGRTHLRTIRNSYRADGRES